MATIVTRAGKGSALTWAEADANFTNLNTDKLEASTVHAATSKTTPVDADEFPGVDSAATYGLKKFTWANIKATLKTYLDSLYWGGASADIASATTLDLTGSRGIVRVTGTTATTGVTLNAGQRVECIAVNAWPLTYHVTNMPLPTNGVNYTCSGTDKVIFTKDNNDDLTIQIEKRSGFANAGGGDAAITLGALGTVEQITANQNDYSGVLTTWGGARLWSDAARDITGITGGWNSRTLALHNAGAYAITLKDESASSTAANRFALTADIVMQPDSVVMLQYDATATRWRAIDATPFATQAEQEASTSTTAAVSPARQQYHPSAAKAWINWNGTGTPAVRASYNMDGSTPITDNGTGDYTLNLNVDMSSANYCVALGHGSQNGSTSLYTLGVSDGEVATHMLAGSLRVRAYQAATLTDFNWLNAVFYGDQA